MGIATSLSPFIVIRAAGEMASAVAWRLYMSHMRRICMIDLDQPLCVRRQVSFCQAIESGSATVEGVRAISAARWEDVEAAWRAGSIAVARTSDWSRIQAPAAEIVVDAILAKRNLCTTLDDAPLVIALGPGFEAGRDCHFVIETNRGHDLGRIIASGCAAPNTGVPGDIGGHANDRVLRAPCTGRFVTARSIGDAVRANDVVGQVGTAPVMARIDGMLRGLIRDGTEVTEGLKIGDIDPRGRREYCDTISDKARAIAGAVLECTLRHCNRPAAG